ncbi:phenoloxidase-activating enzyme-like [Culex pipiens pallens]|uniref:phenoloxidase-activating enzyme-like n=1 Tax=Culex pipiens pallens TaxID=42434 RepID=UPI001953BE5E|nr:phenoloxidase-activating enzyme-like [Culex pipiens pallens]
MTSCRLLSTLIFVFTTLLFWVEPYSCDVTACIIPGTYQKKGQCVTPDQCPELVSLEFEPNFSYKKYLNERRCKSDEHGNPRICCDPTATPRTGRNQGWSPSHSGHRKTQAANGFCLSFRFEPGRCVPIESCPSIHNCSIELQQNYNPTLHLHLTQSFCYQEGSRIYVCCDDHLPEQVPALKPVKKLGWQRCQTPFLDAGKCVAAGRCGLIEDGDAAVPEEYRAFMVGCDQPNGVAHMCCPGKEIRYDEEFGKQCSTVPGRRSGNCVEPDRCDEYVKASDKQGYVRDNWCYTSLDQVDYVCCAKKKILSVPISAITIGNRAGEDAPTCTTPNSAPGRCVPLAECTPIVKILRDASTSKQPVSPAQATFLRNSVCTPGGTSSSAYYVCCDEVSLQTVTTQATPTAAPTVRSTTTTEDIASHPNLRLLDRTTCGRGNLDDKIAFGEQAPMYQYPWMAMLIYRSSSGQEGPECGGTIINNRYVLTAAHCIDGQVERLSYVRLGEYDTRTDPDCDEYMDCAPPVQRYTVEESRIHPNFTRVVRSGNDIGLLRLDRPIVFSSDDVAPICLPFTNSLVRFDPSLFWITGWGLTERLDNSPILLQTRIPSVACSLSTHSICAGFGNGTLHCRGDSGGPMKVQVPEFNFRYVQYGIISAGPGCGVGGAPGVSTRVAFFMRWILDNIRE